MKFSSIASAAALAVVSVYGLVSAAPSDCGYQFTDAPSDQVQNINPFGRWARCNNLKLCFSDYANVAASGSYLEGGSGEFELIQWNSTDTNDWAINSGNRSQLVLRNEGTWTLSARVQLQTTYFPFPATYNAHFRVNGILLKDTQVKASLSPLLTNPASTVLGELTITFTRKFRKGEQIQLEVLSNALGIATVTSVMLNLNKIGGFKKNQVDTYNRRNRQ